MSAHELVIDASPHARLRQALRELWAFRGTVLALAERDVRVKYKEAVLGIAWAGLQPLALMAIFALVFGRYAKVPSGEAPYAVSAFSALVPWFFLLTSITMGANVLLQDASLMRKLYFPREVAVLGAILATAVDFAIALGVFAVVAPFLGADVSPVWLLAPLFAVVLAVLAAAVALAFAGLNIYYRDFRHLLPFLLQVWFFASPVIYPLEVFPESWHEVIAVVNPAAGVLDSFRQVLAVGELPDPLILSLSTASTFVLAWLAYRLFKNLEPNFADVV